MPLKPETKRLLSLLLFAALDEDQATFDAIHDLVVTLLEKHNQSTPCDPQGSGETAG